MMAPRTRTINQKKKETKAKSNKPIQMTDEKWMSMKQFGSFVVRDSDDEDQEHKFTKDDNAAILPHSIPPGKEIEDTDYWLGRIKDIRAEIHDDGTNTVWVKVQWFYSAKDVANIVKSFDESTVGEYERIFSDHCDFLVPQCFNAIIPVIQFNENDPEPPFMPWDTFYQRYEFEYKTRSIKPKPGSSSCICNLPYDPNDKSPSSIMHFCPRPSCRRAYHHRCLTSAKSKESSTALVETAAAETTASSPSNSDVIVVSNTPPPPPTRKHGRATRSSNNNNTNRNNNNDVIVVSPTKRTRTTQKKESPTLGPDNPLYSRAFRLLTCSPDTDDNVDLASLIPLTVSDIRPDDDEDDEMNIDPQPSQKKRRSSRRKSSIKQAPIQLETEVKPSRTLADALADIPFDLLLVAEQPLIRGGAFRNGGLSGNVAFVTRARRLVYQLVEGQLLPEKWEDVVFGEGGEAGLENALVKIGSSKKQLLPFVCPSCKSAI